MFHPFHATRFDASKIGAFDRVLTPPYDVITAEQRTEYMRHSPYNFLNLDLPEPTEQGYAKAAETYKSWLASGVLIKDTKPSILLYELSFKLGAHTHSRLGVIGTMDLTDYSKKHILPHERTLSGPKIDRMNLMKALHTQLSPIFVLTPDPQKKLHSSWAEWISCGTTLWDVRDSSGCRHIMTQVYDRRLFQLMDEMMEQSQQQVMIVDGHHRFETALAYSKELTAQKGKGPWNRVLTYLTVMEDPDLICLATHRVIRNLESYAEKKKGMNELMQKLGWEARPHSDLVSLVNDLEKTQKSHHVMGWAEKKKWTLWIKERTETPEVIQLHEIIFKKQFGMTQSDLDEQRYLAYIKGSDPKALSSAMEHPETQCIFLVGACRNEDVFRWAAQGHVMPQKSTFFYPKILSGGVLYAM